MKWYEETLHSDLRQTLRVAKILHREKTDLQDLIIFQNPKVGRVLALDGIIQTTEGDEFIYHEMLAHVPILALAAAGRPVKKVLIIGGGDGGCLREVLKHKQIHATMVEIDPYVINLSKKFLPGIHQGSFDNKRGKIVIADGAKFVEETKEKFDVVIIDSTDPIGPGAVLFTKKFYAGCRKALAKGGILVTQNGVPFMQGDEVTTSHKYFNALFNDGWFYMACVPTYAGGFMTLGWATDDVRLRKLPVAKVMAAFKRAKLKTRYYTPELQVGAFALPRFVRDLFEK